MSKLRFVGYQNKKESRKELRELYNTAFPKEEQLPFWMIKARLKKGLGELYGIYDDEEFVGLVHNTFYKDMVYIFYFAIHESKRGKGYGGRVLQTLQKKYSDKRIFLCIEAMDPEASNYDQRVKRKVFYEKNGFKMLPFSIQEGTMEYDCMALEGRRPEVTARECESLVKHFLGPFMKIWIVIQKMDSLKNGIKKR